MTLISQQDVEKALSEAGLLEAAKSSYFSWGFKIDELDGEKILRGITPEEYKAIVKANHGKELSEIEIMSPSCSYASLRCVSNGCRQVGGSCSGPHYGGSGYYYCHCDY